MNLIRPRFALSAGLALCVANTASAQSNWVDFVDETNARLVLTSVDLATDPEEKDFATGDFDNDGDTDLICVRKVPFTVAGPRTNVLLMNENGVLTERNTPYALGFSTPDDTRDLWVFDVDNDGWLDFVTASTWFEQPRCFMNLGNDGMGNWMGFVVNPGFMTAPFSPPPKFCSVVSGDVNNDGWDDLFFSDYENPLGDRIAMNNGNGTFTDESDTRLLTGLFQSTFGTQGHIEDLNGDGWKDIVNASGSFDPTDANYNNGSGVFIEGFTFPTAAAYQSNVGDMDNDGDLDVYICDDSQDYIFFNEGTPIPGGQVTWSSAVGVTNSFLTQGFNHHNHFADIDRDGWLDLGQADVDVDSPGCGGQFALLRNNLAVSASRGYSDPNNSNFQPWNTFGNYDFAWIDINGDGCLDMVQGLCSGYKLFIQTDCDVQMGPGTDLCNGDGGNQAGCTDCPCFNDSPAGTVGGCLNSSGNGSRLIATGDTSVSLPMNSSADLRFSATGGPASQLFILNSGNAVAPTNPASPCFGMNSGAAGTLFDGLRCAVMNTLRNGGRGADGNGEVGVTNNPWGGESNPPGGIAQFFGYGSGVTKFFQGIHRDSTAVNCSTGLNTTQAVEITFTP